MTLSTDGWIWSFTGRARLSNKQLQEYLDDEIKEQNTRMCLLFLFIIYAHLL